MGSDGVTRQEAIRQERQMQEKSLSQVGWTTVGRTSLLADAYLFNGDLNVIYMTGWWFQTFFIFHNIWDNPSHWLSYFSEGRVYHQPDEL